ncbi:MAG TPA: tetratricopeptide repeat protein [Usitatibacter sp.]|jgi:tetratricopeptide (TPR) repeat protein|nr:tetratricopeptide repeat protein [Usitatibacter sp.]
MMAAKKWWAILAAATALAAAVPAMADDADEQDAAAQESSAAADGVYEYLTAELAAQRGDLQGALAIFHRLARELHDPAIARRAVETAFRARAFGPALDSAVLLLELDPQSALAREIIAALLANEGDIAKAQTRLAVVLEKSTDRAAILTQMSHLFAKFPDKAAVLAATQELARPYADTPEAHYAIGVAALVAGTDDLAMQETDAALKINPAWEQGAILKAQVLRKTDAASIIPFYEAFVHDNPGSVDVRMQLGRELAADKKLAEARDQFREVEKLAKNDPQPAYAIGLLSLQLEDYGDAQLSFTRALKQGYRDPTSVYLGLGQAAEGLKKYDDAIQWYEKVESSDWVRAQLKIATLIAKQQGLAAGRDYLHHIEPRSPEDSIQIVQVEAQLLRDAKEWQEAYDMLTKAVEEHPDAYELLYDHAMAAERVDRIDVLERDLRKVIEMKPDYAHAYNALGYTLAEKTDRLAEAKALIEKAYKLSPEDPFIIDSLGWVEYRLGDIEDSVKHLHVAYTARPDPEIAAHLGEALWKSGQRDEAQKIWRAALSENPNHETLLAVMAKYHP